MAGFSGNSSNKISITTEVTATTSVIVVELARGVTVDKQKFCSDENVYGIYRSSNKLYLFSKPEWTIKIPENTTLPSIDGSNIASSFTRKNFVENVDFVDIKLKLDSNGYF